MNYKELISKIKGHYFDLTVQESLSIEQQGKLRNDLWDMETAITDLLARSEDAEEENRKLRGIMVQLRRTNRPEKCSVVFEMTYSDALSAEQLETVDAYVFRGLMKADQERMACRE